MLPKLLHTPRFGDERGWFSETYNARRLADAGISNRFVQNNHSHSVRAGTIRGLHFQAFPLRKPSWSVAPRARYGTSQSISARPRPPMAAESAPH